ncbi:MAG: tetratricopeptide repeat protein [Planctomycetota bacterium]
MCPDEADSQRPESEDPSTGGTDPTAWRGPGERPVEPEDPERTVPLEDLPEEDEAIDETATRDPLADDDSDLIPTNPAEGGLLAGALLGRRGPAFDATEIGPYKILKTLGEGGMGTVYLAEQRAPVRRRVALKCVKLGMDTREVVRRFESERQSLALMDHSGIARVFDAGTTAEGRPYFVMEYVHGEPITDFCDRERLSNKERLELFIDVCRAVQHAHMKGVIHRDIKPSNILVSRIDGIPSPKIIDFGIAKAVHQPLEAETELTRVGQMVGTPAYMSPEQASENPVDIDTRSDIYSLGVLLYRLLVGELPYDLEALRRGGYHELRRILREDEPQRPSTRFRRLAGETSTTLADLRRMAPVQIVRQLRGDLDWITMKAMSKDRELRYQSASELSGDVERHLANEPVTAGPPSMAYRVRKLIRRRRGAMTAAFAVAVSLVAGLIVSWVLYRDAEAARQEAESARQIAEEARVDEAKSRERAESERNRALAAEELAENRLRDVQAARDRESLEAKKVLAIKDFLQDMIGSADPGRNGRKILVVDLLASAAEQIRASFHSQPLLQAALASVIGGTFLELGLMQEAEDPLRLSLELHREHLGDADHATIAAATRFGEWLKIQGELLESEKLLSSTLERAKSVLEESSRELSELRRQTADVLRKLSRYDEAEALARTEVASCERIHGPSAEPTLEAKHQLGQVLKSAGKRPEAEALARFAYDSFLEGRGPSHPKTLRAMSTLANLLNEMGRYDEAEPLYRDLLERRREVLGDLHLDTLNAIHALAIFARSRGNLEEAEALMREAVEGSKSLFGLDHPDTARFIDGLASVRMSQSDKGAAEQLYQQALDIRRRVLGEGHLMTIVSKDNLAGLLRNIEGRKLEAEQLMREALESSRKVLGADHPDTLLTTFNLGFFLLEQGRANQSLPYFDALIEGAPNAFGDDHPYLRIFERRAGEAHYLSGSYDRALEILTPLAERLRGRADAISDLRKTLSLLISVYQQQGRGDLAEELRAEMSELGPG